MKKTKRKIISLIVVFALVLGHIGYVEFNANVFAKSINNYSCDYYELTDSIEISKSISKIFSKYDIDDTLNLLMIGCDKGYILNPSLVGNAIGIVRNLKYGGYDICYQNLEDLQSAKALLESDPNIEYVEKNEIFKFDDPVQNDDRAINLSIDDDWGVKAIKIREYIELLDNRTKNREIKIAVLDTGINYNHPLFKGRLEKGYDFVNNNDTPIDDNLYCHGTHVAGIIANALQGLNYKIISYKVLNSGGKGSDIVIGDGIKRAIDDGCSVINMSLGGDEKIDIDSQKCKKYRYHSVIENALNNNVCVVAAAGNDNIDAKTQCPSHIQHRDEAGRNDVICVGSINITQSTTTGRKIEKSDFSNYGDAVDVYVPGEDIISAGLSNNYIKNSGTSMATPFVSAMAAVYKAGNLSLTCREVENKIKENACNVQFSFKNKKNIDVIENAKFATFEKLLNKEPEPEPKLSPVYRLRNKTTGAHYYTIYYNEMIKLTKTGWEDERIRWYSPTDKKEAEKIDGAVGVYKLYNKKLDRHLFTTEGEAQKLVKSYGWELQNHEEPVFYSCGDTEIYRLYNPNDGDHLLTTSWNEREKLRKLGWIPEDNASLKTLKKE